MAAFDYTKVDPDRLCIFANNTEESLNLAEKAFSTIDEAISGILRPAWYGEGSKTFFDQYASDSKSITILMSNLKTLNQQLKQAASVYDRADNEAKSLVDSLTIG
jgi:WXG100 family type VII secretion target